MTNREWILEKMKSMSDEELGEILKIYQLDEEWCLQDCSKPCSECTCEWLKQEHKEKIKLSEVERVILENIDKQYKWIARDKSKNIHVYGSEPVKENMEWRDIDSEMELLVFNHLFQFIKWEDDEPYNIEELLK